MLLFFRVFLLFFIVFPASLISQNVGVSDVVVPPHPSAGLDVNFTDKGFLPPRLSTTQRDQIVQPAVGLTIFNSSKNCLETWTGILWFGPCTELEQQYSNGTAFCHLPTVIVTVTNPATGKTWMDRNLGAHRAALSPTDSLAFGDLYQWGRGADGHQCRNSLPINGLSNTNTPPHGGFIPSNNAPFDWRSPQSNLLWQGVSGINNPCPAGFRLPTQAEWEAERQSWSSNQASGAFQSPLKLPLAGVRSAGSGTLAGVGTGADYWSSTVSGTNAVTLYFRNDAAYTHGWYRASGFAVRCIKN
jgi:uncharacterized protein (TIGR02145 family)